jgi:predicted ATPase
VITEIRIQNARIFDKQLWSFPLNDLTVICGTNSAGKSTILKCLLLLANNISARGSAFSASKEVALAFSNPSIDLGNFKTFVSHNDTSRELHLGVSIENAMSVENYRRLEALAASDTPLEQVNEVAFLPYLFEADFVFRPRQSLVQVATTLSQQALDLKIDDVEEQVSENRTVLCSAQFRIRSGTGELQFDAGLSLKKRDGGKQVDYLLRVPKRLLEPEVQGVPYEYEEDQDPNFGLLRLSMAGLIPDRVNRIPKPSSTTVEEGPRFLPLPGYLDESLNDLRVALSRIAYLGPLRAPARRYYPIHSDPNFQADITGEQLPAVLRERGGTNVTSVNPLTHEILRTTLAEALDTWMYFLRTGLADKEGFHKREIRINSMQDAFVELGIRSPGGVETHALADSGFGFSQVFPILMRGLMLPSGGTLIVEQPEVHLNPALQVRLSDFFVAMSVGHKQVLIETHSEHIVNAIRAIAAEDAESGVSSRCKLFYLESSDGLPSLHEMDVQPDGTIPNWPQGFFGESAQLLGRIMRARKERNK